VCQSHFAKSFGKCQHCKAAFALTIRSTRLPVPPKALPSF
jgi:hypothetical protein